MELHSKASQLKAEVILATALSGGVRSDLLETDEGHAVYHEAPELGLPSPETAGWVLTRRPLPGSWPQEVSAYPLESLSRHLRTEGEGLRLSLAPLLGADAAGRFQWILRGPLGRDRNFNFALVPGVEAGWQLQDGRVQATLSSYGCELVSQGLTTRRLEGHAGVRHLNLTLRPAGRPEVSVPLWLWVPYPRWRVTGVPGMSEDWSRAGIQLFLESLLDNPDASLWMEFPPTAGGLVQVALEDGDSKLWEQTLVATRRGALCLRLAAFFDDLRSSSRSAFQLSLRLPNGESRPLLHIRREWAPKEVVARPFVREGRRFLDISWTGARSITDRVIRLTSQWLPGCIAEVPVEDQQSQVELDLDALGLPPARYQTEFLINDPWTGQATPTGSPLLLSVEKERWSSYLESLPDDAEGWFERLLATLDVKSLDTVFPQAAQRLIQRSQNSPERLLSYILRLEGHRQQARVAASLLPALKLDDMLKSGPAVFLQLVPAHPSMTVRYGLPQLDLNGLDESNAQRLKAVWRPYTALLGDVTSGALPLPALVRTAGRVDRGRTLVETFVTGAARALAELLPAYVGTRQDALLAPLRAVVVVEEYEHYRRVMQVKRSFEFASYAGTFSLMAVREGSRVFRDHRGKNCMGRHLIPLTKVETNAMIDVHLAARYLTAAIALLQRILPRAPRPKIEAELRELGWRAYQLDPEFYAECLISAENGLRKDDTPCP